MKKLLLFLVVLGALIWWWRQPQLSPLPNSSPNPSPVDNLEIIVYQSKTYRFAYFTVTDLNRLKLIANSEFEDSQNLIDRHQCRQLVNGGFYDENNKPLGWLVTERKEVSKEIASQLFDGFLTLNSLVSIAFDREEFLPRVGLQSGPMLIFKGKALNLNIANDELRRRMVALSANDQLIFLSVVGQDSELSGPYLENLPGLVEAIGQKLGWQVSEAINLDGGTASTFYSDKVYLKELNPVGSVFCYN